MRTRSTSRSPTERQRSRWQTGAHTSLFNLNLAGTRTSRSTSDLTALVPVSTVLDALPSQHASAGIHQDRLRSFRVRHSTDVEPGGASWLRTPLIFTLSARLDAGFSLQLNCSTAGDHRGVTLRSTSSAGSDRQDRRGRLLRRTPTPFDVPGETPIPGAVWLFGGGLGLVAMLGGRRKRKQKSVWEVTQNA